MEVDPRIFTEGRADRKYKRGALALTIPCAARFMPDKLTFYKLFAAPHPPTAGGNQLKATSTS